MFKRILLLFSRNVFFLSKERLLYFERQLEHFKNEETIFKKLNNAHYYLNKGKVEALSSILNELKQNK